MTANILDLKGSTLALNYKGSEVRGNKTYISVEAVISRGSTSLARNNIVLVLQHFGEARTNDSNWFSAIFAGFRDMFTSGDYLGLDFSGITVASQSSGMAWGVTEQLDPEEVARKEAQKRQRQLNKIKEDKVWRCITVVGDLYTDTTTMEYLDSLESLNTLTAITSSIGSAGKISLGDYGAILDFVDTDDVLDNLLLQTAYFYESTAKQYAFDIYSIVNSENARESLDWETANKLMDLCYNAYYCHGKATFYCDALQEKYSNKYGNNWLGALKGFTLEIIGLDSSSTFNDYVGAGVTARTAYKTIFKAKDMKVLTNAVMSPLEKAVDFDSAFSWVTFLTSKDSDLAEFDKQAENNSYTKINAGLQKIWLSA
jgi:hypothetical protein